LLTWPLAALQKQHLPGFVQKAAEFKTKGIDEIACLSVNDAFVMDAWGKDQGADGKVCKSSQWLSGVM
jgi:peroxiredoxin